MVSSIGLTFQAETPNQMILWSIMKDSGGADCLMEKVSIKKSMEICLLEALKMDSSMAKEFNIMEMVTTIKENLLMVCHKDMANIYGQKEAHTEVILNRAREMDMDFGKPVKIVYSATKGIFQMIKRQDMGFINGITGGYIKAISIMIIEMDSVNFTILRDH